MGDEEEEGDANENGDQQGEEKDVDQEEEEDEGENELEEGEDKAGTNKDGDQEQEEEADEGPLKGLFNTKEEKKKFGAEGAEICTSKEAEEKITPATNKRRKRIQLRFSMPGRENWCQGCPLPK